MNLCVKTSPAYHMHIGKMPKTEAWSVSKRASVSHVARPVVLVASLPLNTIGITPQ